MAEARIGDSGCIDAREWAGGVTDSAYSFFYVFLIVEAVFDGLSMPVASLFKSLK